MTTNNEIVILGLLAEEPKHGYQPEQDMGQRGMHNWPGIRFSSFYYILNKIEKKGWLTSKEISSGERPMRKVNQLTPEGKKSLAEEVYKRLVNPNPRSSDFELVLANPPILSTDDYLFALQTYCDNLKERLQYTQSKRDADSEAGIQDHIEILFDHSAIIYNQN